MGNASRLLVTLALCLAAVLAVVGCTTIVVRHAPPVEPAPTCVAPPVAAMGLSTSPAVLSSGSNVTFLGPPADCIVWWETREDGGTTERRCIRRCPPDEPYAQHEPRLAAGVWCCLTPDVFGDVYGRTCHATAGVAP